MNFGRDALSLGFLFCEMITFLDDSRPLNLSSLLFSVQLSKRASFEKEGLEKCSEMTVLLSRLRKSCPMALCVPSYFELPFQ